MKKTLFSLSVLGLALLGLGTASAQYYTDYTTASYPSYTATSYYYQRPYYYGSYGSGIGSYTIGCTTYYYNTSTGAQLYTQNICNNYNISYGTSYPTSYYYYTTPSTYYYPTTYYGNYSSYSSYQNCYYTMYGQYMCSY